MSGFAPGTLLTVLKSLKHVPLTVIQRDHCQRCKCLYRRILRPFYGHHGTALTPLTVKLHLFYTRRDLSASLLDRFPPRQFAQHLDAAIERGGGGGVRDPKVRVAPAEEATGNDQELPGNGCGHKFASRSPGRLGKDVKRAAGPDQLVIVGQTRDDPVALGPIRCDLLAHVDVERRRAGPLRRLRGADERVLLQLDHGVDPNLANIVIDTGTTSASGEAADGALGCFNGGAGEITLLQGWNWFAGADPTLIGAGQYDFQTTVTHELGHALGLGGALDPNSPMYESLATGVANRSVSVADLNIPEPPEGADPQMAAGFADDAADGGSFVERNSFRFDSVAGDVVQRNSAAENGLGGPSYAPTTQPTAVGAAQAASDDDVVTILRWRLDDPLVTRREGFGRRTEALLGAIDIVLADELDPIGASDCGCTWLGHSAAGASADGASAAGVSAAKPEAIGRGHDPSARHTAIFAEELDVGTDMESGPLSTALGGEHSGLRLDRTTALYGVTLVSSIIVGRGFERPEPFESDRPRQRWPRRAISP